MSIKISDSPLALSLQLAAFGPTPAAGETSVPQAFDDHLEERLLPARSAALYATQSSRVWLLPYTLLRQHSFEPKPILKESLTHAAHHTRIPRALSG
jgi:hypothetical protein